MNREETLKFLALIKVAYPESYKDMDKSYIDATINMWQTTFPDVPYVIMAMAFNNFRKKSVFAPKVAEMFTELRNIHYAAMQDKITANEYDPKLLKKAEFIVENTRRFSRRFIEDDEINYGLINDRMLMSADNKNALPKGRSEGVMNYEA